ncbi:MAG: hypothetical protein KGL39_29025 [Patescibacteria group bacterium]|nr:hypothetical protein [Patescibacteria group bacterium]
MKSTKNGTRLLPLMVAMFLSAAALTMCSQKVEVLPPRPNQLTTLDGQAYDVLFIAHAAIEKAKSEFTAGLLPKGASVEINDTVKSYNLARATWLTYRAVILSQSASSDTAQTQAVELNNDLAQLQAAIKVLQGGGQ